MYEATRERIGEIIGEASMCWSETPKGIFNYDINMQYQVKKRWEYFIFSDDGQFSRFINSFNIDPRTDFIDRSWVAGRFAHQRGVCGLFLVDEEQVERMHQWLQSKKN